MSRILTANYLGYQRFSGAKLSNQSKAPKSAKVLSMWDKKTSKISREVQGNVSISLVTTTFILVSLLLVSGAFYLYQVNDLATKGYEMKEVENQIQQLEKERKKMEIKEVELKSMYNLEKATRELNLMNPASVSYVEIQSPVAMK